MIGTFIDWANELPFFLMLLVAIPIGVIGGIAAAALCSWYLTWAEKQWLLKPI